MNSEYTSKDACGLGGVTIPQLEHLVQTGAVRPVREGFRGRGGGRQFSLHGIVEIAVAAQLLDHGVPVRAIGHVMDGLRPLLIFSGAELKQRMLVVEHGARSEAFGPFVSREYKTPEDVAVWLREGHSGVVVNIPAILNKIEQATGRSVSA